MKNKALKGVIVSSIMLCFSLFAAISGTVAWFASNNVVTATGISVQCTDPNIMALSYDIYYWDEDSLEGKKSGEEKTYVLEQYDSFIESRNEKIDRLIRVEIYHKQPITVDQNLFINTTCFGELLDSKSYVLNSISNIIQFQAVIASCKDENGTYLYRNENIDETDANTTFVSVHNYLRETEAYKDEYSSFLNISYSTPENSSTPVETAEKTKSLDIVFCDGNDIVKAGSLYTVLFIGYTYNPTLVDYYFDHSEIDKDVGIISGNDIKFDDDIDSMTVDFVSNKVGS